MTLSNILGGTLGIIVAVIFILWVICWFLVPFWIMTIRDSAVNIEKLTKEMRSSLGNIEKMLTANMTPTKSSHLEPKQSEVQTVGKYKFRDGKLDMDHT